MARNISSARLFLGVEAGGGGYSYQFSVLEEIIRPSETR